MPTTPYAATRTPPPSLPVMRVLADPTVAGPEGPVALSKDVCIVGRDWGVHLPLGSALVSKVHALIVRDRDGVYVRDLASTNHVLVNGQPIREAGLGAGDVVRVGPFQLACTAGFDRPVPRKHNAPDTRAPAARLDLDRGHRHVRLDSRAVLIGTRPDCEIHVDGDAPGVAPVHAVIFELDGQRYVRDFNTPAGTRVNDRGVHQRVLAPGDEIRVGPTRIRYLTADTPSSPAVADDEEAPIPLELDAPIPVLAAADVETPADVDLAGSAWEALAAGESTEQDDAADAEWEADLGVAPLPAEPAAPETPDAEELRWDALDARAPFTEPEIEPPAEPQFEPEPEPQRIDPEPLALAAAPPPPPGAALAHDPDDEHTNPDPAGPPAPGDSPDPADRARAVERLDEIVLALAHDVAELEHAWKEARPDDPAAPDSGLRVPEIHANAP